MKRFEHSIAYLATHMVFFAVISGNPCNGDYDSLSMRIEIQDREILFGDVYYAEVIFENIGDNVIRVENPVVGYVFDVTTRASRDQKRGVSAAVGAPVHPRTLIVSDFTGAEMVHIGKRDLLPEQRLSVACMLRAISIDVNSNSFPPANQRQVYKCRAYADFDAEVTILLRPDAPLGRKPGINDRAKEVKFRQGRTLELNFSGTSVNSYKALQAIHGFVRFNELRDGALRSGQFPVNRKTWAPITHEVNPDSNLARLLRFSDEYVDIINSDQTEDQQLEALRAMVDAMRPLERRWITVRIRQSLQRDLPSVYQAFIETNNKG